MSKFLLVAESGADIDPKFVEQYQISIVPMHVSFDDETLDDLSFPVDKIIEYHSKTGKIPKTSGSNPGEFNKVFDELHAKYPDKHIIHLAYSAVTTVSYQSAVIASEGRDYVTSIDTKQVSIGQGTIVIKVARFLEENPDCTLEEVCAEADRIIKTVHMGFIPGDLSYLKAGGRVSNAQYLGAKMLNLNPMIEILDGKLMSVKKYRGSLKFIASKVFQDLERQYNFDKDFIVLGGTATCSEEIIQNLKQAAKDSGYKEIIWMDAGCVICVHGGPGAFGIVGISKE